jgi:hypothetical protein
MAWWPPVQALCACRSSLKLATVKLQIMLLLLCRSLPEFESVQHQQLLLVGSEFRINHDTAVLIETDKQSVE